MGGKVSGGTEGALRGFSGIAVGVLEVHAQREAGAGRQVPGVDLGGEVGRFAGGGPAEHPLEGAAAAERGAVVVDCQQTRHQPPGAGGPGP